MLSFQGVGSSDAPPRSPSRWDSLSQLLRRYTTTVRRFIQCWRLLTRGGTVCFKYNRRIDRRFPLTKASVHPVLKGFSWRVSVFIQTRHQIDRRCQHSDRRIIQCYCLHFFFSATCPTLLGNGPSVHPTVPKFSPVYQLVRRLHRRLLFRYCRFIRRCSFPSFSSRLQLGFLLQLNILNMLLLIASKYILSPQFFYK
jgi:hypothetical protein